MLVVFVFIIFDIIQPENFFVFFLPIADEGGSRIIAWRYIFFSAEKNKII